jgi:very-short-patch-repair endonuclease
VQARQRSRSVYRDVLYEDFGVVVETDGVAAHPAETRWRDQDRDNAAAIDGVVTLRYGWGAITERPCAVAGEVAALLRRRGWTGCVSPCGPGCVATAEMAAAARRWRPLRSGA